VKYAFDLTILKSRKCQGRAKKGAGLFVSCQDIDLKPALWPRSFLLCGFCHLTTC